MVRRLKKRRARLREIPLVVVDLWMRGGRDYFDDLAEHGYEPTRDLIPDDVLIPLWDDFRDELEAEWANPRSPFYNWPEQGEPHIYEVLRRHA
ncbi:MAG: hypothetical protein E5X80_05065 [Mesorhizobium sp.]|uniref:hypothetical protein n=1 Tax=Mesorhizobium sp. TaxID=1871066 RepID=UPI0011F85D11|nr:hypothetical protein [Mesorhizobium sp.]TIO52963.1 MAG: hypothetical protein E5X78_09980 [Mesorhizobium sp.]TIO61796.1 MAG: hypothetical protein E5X79_05360 [Mesorhizobium sp.]TJV66749.1 MAG: hypothetical protein E5X80_05065 [Mesorhizobium sp.]